MTPAFQRDQAVDRATLEPFRARVPDGAKAAFDQGIGFLARRRLCQGRAELQERDRARRRQHRRSRISGRGVCGLGARPTSRERVADGAGRRDRAVADLSVARRCADAHARLGEARAVLEEAVGKWPSDVRFTKPLAMLYAHVRPGPRGGAHARAISLGAARRPRALYLAVEWIYHVRSGGRMGPQSRRGSEARADLRGGVPKAGGPQVALVKQWMDFLENEKQ